MAVKLGQHYPILFKGPAGTCAHEFILDLRPLKDSAGIEVRARRPGRSQWPANRDSSVRMAAVKMAVTCFEAHPRSQDARALGANGP